MDPAPLEVTVNYANALGEDQQAIAAKWLCLYDEGVFFY